MLAWSTQLPSALSVAGANDSGPVQVTNAQELARARAVCLAELAWLANSATFHEQLSGALVGDCLEIHGTVSNETTRNLAMKLAREASHLTVVDHTIIASVPAQPAPSRSLTMVYQDAMRTLYHDCPQLSRALTVSTQDRGEILVRGEVPTLEDKLTISRALRAVAGCSCVKNQVRAKTGSSISVNAPGAKPPLQDNSLLARLGLVTPRTEMVATTPPPARHPIVREASAQVATTSTPAPKTPVRESQKPTTPQTEMTSAAPAVPRTNLSPFHAIAASTPAPAMAADKSTDSLSVSAQPVAGSILLTSTAAPSESERLRCSVALACGIEEKAVLVVAKEGKSIAITMTLPDVETGKSMAAKVLAMPELTPYGVSLDVRIAP
jgi:hypothetical protein